MGGVVNEFGVELGGVGEGEGGVLEIGIGRRGEGEEEGGWACGESRLGAGEDERVGVTFIRGRCGERKTNPRLSKGTTARGRGGDRTLAEGRR